MPGASSSAQFHEGCSHSSVEVEFIRQTSFLSHRLKVVAVSSLRPGSQIFTDDSRLLSGFALSSPFGSRRLRNLLESVAGQILISSMNRYITQSYDTDKTVVAA